MKYFGMVVPSAQTTKKILDKTAEEIEAQLEKQKAAVNAMIFGGAPAADAYEFRINTYQQVYVQQPLWGMVPKVPRPRTSVTTVQWYVLCLLEHARRLGYSYEVGSYAASVEVDDGRVIDGVSASLTFQFEGWQDYQVPTRVEVEHIGWERTGERPRLIKPPVELEVTRTSTFEGTRSRVTCDPGEMVRLVGSGWRWLRDRARAMQVEVT